MPVRANDRLHLSMDDWTFSNDPGSMRGLSGKDTLLPYETNPLYTWRLAPHLRCTRYLT